MAKAQISIFIILALVLALSIGTYLYLTSEAEVRRIETVRPVIEKAPLEFAKAVDFVNNCLYETSKAALLKLGEGGGYIDTAKIKRNPFEPTESEGIELSPESELVVPYWWYLKDKNSCEGKCLFESKRLPIERSGTTMSIEGQIDSFIEQNLGACLNDFRALKSQRFEVIEQAKPKATTTVANDDVFVTLKYPLLIKKAGIAHKQDTFLALLDVNFREIYDFASKLAELEAEHNYLEKDIRELIDAFSRLDEKALPPVSDLRFGFGIGKIWIKLDIEKRLKELFTNYIQLLQVAGTRNHKIIKAPTTAGILDTSLFETLYNRGMIIPLEENHPTLTAKYNYLDWWKPYVNIGGCRGQICQSESWGSTFMLVLGLQRYNFVYDVSLPVLVEISNEGALKGEGYSFNFALEANLRDNKPMPSEFTPLKPIAENTMPSMFCDADKRNGGELTLTLIDGRTKKGVDDALVSYSCGTTSCAIGMTANGVLKAKMPQCLGGIIGAEKYDFHPAFAPFDTNTGDDQKLTLTIEPYRKVDFSLKKYLLKKGLGWELDLENAQEQANDEETLITLERKTLPYEEPFTVFGKISGGPLSKDKDYSKEISMIPGTYDVKLYTIKYPKPAIIIPKQKRCFRGGILDEKECFFVPNESIVFNTTKKPLPNGGAEFEYTISGEELDGAKEIEWKVLNFAIDKVPEADRRIEDLDQLGKLNDYALEIKDSLKPVLKK